MQDFLDEYDVMEDEDEAMNDILGQSREGGLEASGYRASRSVNFTSEYKVLPITERERRCIGRFHKVEEAEEKK